MLRYQGKVFLFFVGVLVYFSYMSYTVQMQVLQFTLIGLVWP
jgi:hypothetical protein